MVFSSEITIWFFKNRLDCLLENFVRYQQQYLLNILFDKLCQTFLRNAIENTALVAIEI